MYSLLSFMSVYLTVDFHHHDLCIFPSHNNKNLQPLSDSRIQRFGRCFATRPSRANFLSILLLFHNKKKSVFFALVEAAFVTMKEEPPVCPLKEHFIKFYKESLFFMASRDRCTGVILQQPWQIRLGPYPICDSNYYKKLLHVEYCTGLPVRGVSRLSHLRLPHCDGSDALQSQRGASLLLFRPSNPPSCQ